MKASALITQSKDILGGIPVFFGTRVPIKTLTDYLIHGDTIDDFLDDFPSVSREQAMQLLQVAQETLLTSVSVNINA
jgi:uncharacterized protein (DUF433 family)